MPTQSQTRMSPYHFYNLRRNPFGELTRQERAELAVIDIDRWRDLLRNKQAVVQFMGPCGHGKTTHLLAIQRELPDAEYIYLAEAAPQPRLGRHRPMLVDEAQRLSFWSLRKLLAASGPLVLGTHVDLTSAIRRARLEVVTVEVDEDSSTTHLAEILNRRVAASRLGHGPLPIIDEHWALRLQRKHGSNIRAIEHFLYEQFQSCALERKAWPPAT